MSCSDVDLKGFVWGEVSGAERERTLAHVDGCGECRGELDRLEATGVALRSLADEEIPQRIAFVSDKVFEPSWWQRIWHSGPAMGFASAAVLAGAILVHGAMRPVNVPVQTAPVVASLSTADVDARVNQELARRLPTEVAKAVAASEERQAKQTALTLAAVEKRFEVAHRRDDQAVEVALRFYHQQRGRFMVASAETGIGAQQ